MDVPSAFPGISLPLSFEALCAAMGQHVILSITDVSGRIVHVNPLFCEISGYAEHELIGQTHRIIKSAEHAPEFFSTLWEMISHGKIWQGEVCNRHKSGTSYWVKATIVPVLGSDGLPTHYVSARTDITDQRHKIRQIAQLAAEQDELLRLSPFGIARVKHRHFVRVNTAFNAILGYTGDELIGRSTRDIYDSGEQFEEIGRLSYEPLKRGEVVKYEAPLRCKDGSVVWVVAGTCTLNPAYPTSDILYMIQDITGHKQLEAQLSVAVEQARLLGQAKSEFLAVVSHELRTPLNGVLGMAQLLETCVAEDERELVREIRSSGESLLTIVNRIIDYTDIDVRPLEDAMEMVCLAELLALRAEPHALRARRKGLMFGECYAETLYESARVDWRSVESVLDILLDNAVVYTDTGSVGVEAGVVAGKEGKQLHVVIEDTGRGMSAEQLRDIFVPFHQGERALVRRQGGLGLGLALAKKLVDRMGGQLTANSIPGSGSRFELYVPLGQSVDSD